MSTSATLIAGSSLVSFLPGLSTEERSQILDCLLFAELCHANQYDREKQWERWIDAYQQALPITGFRRTLELNAGPKRTTSKKGFQREADRIVTAIASQDLANAARTALDTMFQSPAAQRFFSDWFTFSSSRSDSFQVIPCQKNRSGQIEIAVCGMRMTTRTTVSKNPFSLWPFTYELTLLLKGGTFSFDSATHATNRARIEQELREVATEYLERIPL